MDEKFRDFERKGTKMLEMKNSVNQINSVKHPNRLHEKQEKRPEIEEIEEILHSNIHKDKKISMMTIFSNSRT